MVRLSRVVFDDELFVDGRVDLLAARERDDLGRAVGFVELEPFGMAAVLGDFELALRRRRSPWSARRS